MSEVLQAHLKTEKPKKAQVPGIWPQIDKFNYVGLKAEDINEEEIQDKSRNILGIDLSLVGKAKPVRIPGPPLQNRHLKDFHIKAQILKTLPITNQVGYRCSL
jgi:hypothetical protein